MGVACPWSQDANISIMQWSTPISGQFQVETSLPLPLPPFSRHRKHRKMDNVVNTIVLLPTNSFDITKD